MRITLRTACYRAIGSGEATTNDELIEMLKRPRKRVVEAVWVLRKCGAIATQKGIHRITGPFALDDSGRHQTEAPKKEPQLYVDRWQKTELELCWPRGGANVGS